MVGKLVELRRFDGTVGAERLAELVFETVATTDPALAPVVHQAISELGANVPQHSGRESGFLADSATHEPGTCASPSAMPEPACERHSGQGLASIVRAARRARGSLTIASGQRALHLYPQGETMNNLPERLRGTIVQVELPCVPAVRR